jgi:hypothetical protein
MKKKVILTTLIVLVALALLIQLIPLPARGHNPAVVQDVKWDTPQTAALVRRACYDCHSNETVWPWYSYVAPVSWLIYNDVQEGRQHLNFSNAGNLRRDKNEIIGMIQEGGMPPAVYLPLHPSARLTSAEKQQLIQGITNSLP